MESTPLLPEIQLKAEQVPSERNLEARVLGWLTMLPALAVRSHWFSILLATLSAVVCWCLEGGRRVIVDFRVSWTVMAFVAFAMGFRNTNANQRRVAAMDQVHRFTAAFWGIYTPLPDELRSRFQAPLAHAVGEIVNQLFVASSYEQKWFGVVSLRPACCKDGQGCHCPEVPVTFSPRALVVSTLLALEEELEQLEGKHGKLCRNLVSHKEKLLNSYDALFTCTVPAVGVRYLMFIDMSLLLFTSILPWSIKVMPLHFPRFTVGALPVLLASTWTACLVLFSFEALTRQSESPLSSCMDEDDLCLQHLCDISTLAMRGYDCRLSEAERLPGPAGAGPPTLERLRCQAMALGFHYGAADAAAP